MKNYFFLALVAAFCFFISSCSNDSLPGVGVNKTLKVPKMCTVPELAPRYGCKGTELPDPKVVGWHNVVDTAQGFCIFSNKELEAAGYFYKGKSLENNGTDSVFTDSNFPWSWLLWLVGLGLAFLLFFLLFGLARRMWAWATDTLNRDGNITSSNNVVSETTPSTPPIADPGYRANYNNCTITNNDNYGTTGNHSDCCYAPHGELMTEKITIERSYFDPRRSDTQEMH